MSQQKTVRKTRKRKSTKAATTNSGEEGGVRDEQTPAAVPDESTDSGAAPAAKRKRRTRKKRTASASRKSTTAKRGPTGKTTSAEADVQPDDKAVKRQSRASATLSVKPLSPNAEVETSGEAIVIRFPPVALPPFSPGQRDVPVVKEPEPTVSVTRSEPAEPDDSVDREPEPEAEGPPEVTLVEAEAPADTAADASAVSAGADVPAAEEGPAESASGADEGEPAAAKVGRKRRRRGRRKKAKLAEPQPDEPVDEAAPSEQEVPASQVEDETARPSASKRRRLRRKRRSDRDQGEPAREEGAAETPEIPETPEITETTEAAEDDKPVEETEAPTSEAAAPTKRRRSRGRGRKRAAAAEETASPKEEVAETSPPVDRPTKEMIINVFPREECRIAILHKGVLEEIYIERASSENHVGNIYKGVITNVEPSIQAAFIDFGLEKNGFLHVSDLHPQYFPDGGQPAENVGCKIPRRNRPPIQRCLRRGQEMIVQITKEGIGTKGPTLSTYLSIPGRFLVMMPGMRRLGVSRKIEDDETRHKLRTQLSELELPDGIGFIARTAAQGRTKRELQSDLKYLVRLWRAVEKRVAEERAPAELYRESDLVIRTIRDLYSADIGSIVVDDSAVAKRAREFLHIFSPRSGDVVTEYTDSAPIFHKYGVEAELDRLHSRHVPLKSGGSLVIEPTEALVAIDVNSGRFRAEDDAETTAFKINAEAADEIARQLRLRDLGGVIICDFIDMRIESHKREIERRLAKNLKEHKERAKILRTSAFGIIEMTRQRQRASLTRNIYQDCHHCRGTGLVRTVESVSLDVMRTLQVNVVRDSVCIIEVSVSLDVALLLLNRKRALLREMEAEYRRTITIQPNRQFGLDQVEIRCWDQRGRSVPQI